MSACLDPVLHWTAKRVAQTCIRTRTLPKGTACAESENVMTYDQSLEKTQLVLSTKCGFGLRCGARCSAIHHRRITRPPEMATTLGAYITHMNLTDVGRRVSMGGALIGGAFVTVFVALVCASSGWLYNPLDQR